MKRIICFLLCLLLVFPALPALAAGVSEVMCVTNCQEWVSLRQAPDTSSKRLEKVHLGELVTDCVAAYDDFIQCEFNGKTGYIPRKYLKMTDFSSGESFPGNQMVVNCSEWVSMWEMPDSSSKRLTKVPLGAIVTSCVVYMGNYIYCEYKGTKGYISTTYLKKANYNAAVQDTSIKPAANYPVIEQPMVVVNCNEWVSLREKASTSAARLAKVPLGAQVYDCVQVSDTFIYCRYNGVWGYIQASYLSEPEGNEPEYPEDIASFSVLPYLPSYGAFLATGSDIFQETYHGYTIVARRAYGSREEMMAVCYDLNQNPLWQLRESSLGELSDVVQTDAFIGGTILDPLLIWFINGKGFTAYEVGPQLKVRWVLPESDALNIANSICSAVDHDGTIYIAFDNALVSISPAGQLQWKAQANRADIFWPAEIIIDDIFVDVRYDNHPELDGVHDTARFTKDGFVLKIIQTQGT